jgi:hypothetical protein
MAAFYDLGVVAGELPGAPGVLRTTRASELLLDGRWKELIPQDQWDVFLPVIQRARARGIQFGFGGAFAVATYTGKWRNTKDMDLYILPEHREEMIAALNECGLEDYFPVKEYDRTWIYRAHSGDVIVDTIWAMANHRADVDLDWLTRGPVVEFGGEMVPVIPPEELIWSKLYVMQKERCDWPDVLNLIHATGPALDWRRLLTRLGEDILLLDGILSVFQWIAPDRAAELPAWLWSLRKKSTVDPAHSSEHVRALDSRPWFRPMEGAD